MIDELVSSDTDQPSDTHQRRVGALQCRDRGHERLSRQVFSIRNATAAREQISVHLG